MRLEWNGAERSEYEWCSGELDEAEIWLAAFLSGRNAGLEWISVAEAEKTGREPHDFIFARFVDGEWWETSTTHCGWEVVREQGWTHATRVVLPNRPSDGIRRPQDSNHTRK